MYVTLWPLFVIALVILAVGFLLGSWGALELYDCDACRRQCGECQAKQEKPAEIKYPPHFNKLA